MKFEGINKFYYKSQYGEKCNHLKYAVKNNMLALSPDVADIDHEQLNSDMFFDLLEAFDSEVDSTPDAIKYFVSLKDKVLEYYKKTHKKELEGYLEKFQIAHEGLYSVLDFVKINNKTKTIDVIIIKPSTYNSMFLKKTWKKVLANVTSLMEGHDIYLPWLKGMKCLCFSEEEKMKMRREKQSTRCQGCYQPFIDHLNLDESTNLKTLEELGFLRYLLIPSLYSSSKKSMILDLTYIATLMSKAYPKHTININVPLINKTLKPFTFTTLNFTQIPNTVAGKLNLKVWNAILFKMKSQYDSEDQPFVLPEWLKYFDTQTKCKICKKYILESAISLQFNEDEYLDEIDKYPNKIAMFDFETINDPLPNAKHYMPYDKIVVQISCHLMEDNKVVKHLEYIVKDISKNELDKIYSMLVSFIEQGYHLAAYYKAFENAAIKTMERVLGRYDISKHYNLSTIEEKRNEDKMNVLDLWVFFKLGSQTNNPKIRLKRFGPSSSIKKTIEIYAGDSNPYKNLNINNGFKAMKELYDVIVLKNNKGKEKKYEELYAYCKQDTLTMVDIYKKIQEIYNKIIEHPEKKQEILEELDK